MSRNIWKKQYLLPLALALLMLAAQCAIALHYPAHMAERPIQEQNDDDHDGCAFGFAINALSSSVVAAFIVFTFVRFIAQFEVVREAFRLPQLRAKAFNATGPPEAA